MPGQDSNLRPADFQAGKRKRFSGSYAASSERICSKRSLTEHGPLDHSGGPLRYPAPAQAFQRFPVLRAEMRVIVKQRRHELELMRQVF